MKKKKIIITTISIFLVAILLGIVITCYQSDNEVITLDDGTIIALVVDGNYSNTLPTSGGYKADITCENASAVWKYNEDNSEWEIELSDITGSVTCYATFTSLTDDDLAVNYIENLLGSNTSVTSGTGYLVNEGYGSNDSVGLRYEGENPNNYVWYNNELWRIIGVIPTLTEDGYQNLVKIKRVDSIGGYAYDGVTSNYTGVWGENTLYTLLNSYYWGALDGTGTSYCMGYQTRSAHCDFTTKGITSSSYYGSMVKYVYWNTGASSQSVTPSTAYANEIATQTVGAYIGLMNASDYGFSYYSTSHSTNMSAYNNASITALNWLYSSEITWTMTPYTSLTQALYLDRSAGVGYNVETFRGYATFPVVYLSSDVYIVDGEGSQVDPYILGTN